MRAIMAAALLSVILALSLTLVVYRPAWTEPEATASPEATPAATPTPAPILPIEIIDGEIWVAIPVDGMPTKGMEE